MTAKMISKFDGITGPGGNHVNEGVFLIYRRPHGCPKALVEDEQFP
jgi:hypothetical protein